MSDLGDNIRRIARTEELQKLIEQLINRDAAFRKKNPIQSKKTTAYITPDGGVGIRPGQDSNDDTDLGSSLPSASAPATTEPELGEQGQVDLADLFTDGAELGDYIGSLTGLMECGGSKEAVVYLDGEFRAYPWDEGFSGASAYEDPRIDTFEAGFYYRVGGFESPTLYAAWRAFRDSGANPEKYTYTGYDESVVFENFTDGGVVTATSVNYTKESCTIGESGCPASISASKNPSDDIHQLAFNGAQFLTNELESDADIYAPWGQNIGTGTGPSSITGCTSGGTGVTISAIGNGYSQITFAGGDTYKVNGDGIVVEVP